MSLTLPAENAARTTTRMDWVRVHYEAADDDALLKEALVAIHGKAGFARTKFLWLRHSVHAALLSLVLLVAAAADAAFLASWP